MPAGRPSTYSPAYCEEVITFCGEGYSLTGFAGEIGVTRQCISEWMRVHPEFFVAANKAKAKRAMWWESRARDVAEKGGPGGQATMVIFGLKNHAPDDYSDTTKHELTGKDGAPIEMSVEDKRAAATAILDAAFGAAGDTSNAR